MREALKEARQWMRKPDPEYSDEDDEYLEAIKQVENALALEASIERSVMRGLRKTGKRRLIYDKTRRGVVAVDAENGIVTETKIQVEDADNI